MDTKKPVSCPENQSLADYLFNKRQEIASSKNGICENWDLTFSKAYKNVCHCKTPIKTLKGLSEIKGIGKWILKKMQGFFETDSGQAENSELAEKGKKNKGTKRYTPQKNSAAYAVLITLFREMENGSEFMNRQELIDAAAASGLSRVPILPEKAKGKAGHFGSSPKDRYSGWSSMKTLIEKGLVVKSSSPAKYMLTDEGKDVARECLSRLGMIDQSKSLDDSDLNQYKSDNFYVSTQVDTMVVDLEGDMLDSDGTGAPERKSLHSSASSKRQKKKSIGGLDGDLSDMDGIRAPKRKSSGPSICINKKKPIDVPPEYIDKCDGMGYSEQQIICAFTEVMETSQRKDLSSLWPSVLCRLKEDEIYRPTSIPKLLNNAEQAAKSSSQILNNAEQAAKSSNQIRDEFNTNENIQPRATPASSSIQMPLFRSDLGRNAPSLQACSSTNYAVTKHDYMESDSTLYALPMPPLSFGEKFGDVYEVVLILDNREKFAKMGSHLKKTFNNISSQIKMEVRFLPVGDAIWIARHKCFGSEYVLDFIVERKNVDDLRTSIRDNRYRDQKMRILKCGLKKMIYLVEGDPNSCEAAESIKTACFTTEILEGFDVQRTGGIQDTLRKYGYLTLSINQYYVSLDPEKNNAGVCPPFDEFIKRCEELDKMTVSDVFAVQLMQVPQVTEEIALAVLDLYPTLFSLARAYSLLDGDISTQEEMLKKQSNNQISGPASRNIFQLVWGS